MHWYSINLVYVDNCHKIWISTMRVYLTHDRSKLHHRLEVKMRVAILYLKIWCLKVYLNLNQTLASAEYCFCFCRPFFNLHNVLFCWLYCITLSSNKTTTNSHIISYSHWHNISVLNQIYCWKYLSVWTLELRTLWRFEKFKRK